MAKEWCWAEYEPHRKQLSAVWMPLHVYFSVFFLISSLLLWNRTQVITSVTWNQFLAFIELSKMISFVRIPCSEKLWAGFCTIWKRHFQFYPLWRALSWPKTPSQCGQKAKTERKRCLFKQKCISVDMAEDALRNRGKEELHFNRKRYWAFFVIVFLVSPVNHTCSQPVQVWSNQLTSNNTCIAVFRVWSKVTTNHVMLTCPPLWTCDNYGGIAGNSE